MNDMRQPEVSAEDEGSILAFMSKLYSRLPDEPTTPTTFPALVGRPYDENFLSDYLAYILDPRRNGIGSPPLQSLLTHVDFDYSEVDFADVHIKREHEFQDDSRIDFLITIGNSLVIGIENKVLAPRGPSQTEHYAACIKNEFPHMEPVVILLARGVRGPPSQDFKFVSYRELLGAFRAIQYDWIKDARRSFIWEDFLTHLAEYIAMGGDHAPQPSERSRLYLEHQAVIDDCVGSFTEDSERLYHYLSATIQSQFAEPDWIRKRHKGYQLLYRPAWRTPDYRVFFVAWFTKEILASSWFRFALEVQGPPAKWSRSPHTNRIFDLFESMHPGVVAELEASPLDYRPDDRNTALVSRRYALKPEAANSEFIDAVVSGAVEEFLFLCAPMDETLAAYDASSA